MRSEKSLRNDLNESREQDKEQRDWKCDNLANERALKAELSESEYEKNIVNMSRD